jgi:stalled ribosome alternative rescue factor ArfA
LGYIKEDLLRPSTGQNQSGNGSFNTEKNHGNEANCWPPDLRFVVKLAFFSEG